MSKTTRYQVIDSATGAVVLGTTWGVKSGAMFDASVLNDAVGYKAFKVVKVEMAVNVPQRGVFAGHSGKPVKSGVSWYEGTELKEGSSADYLEAVKAGKVK